MHTIAEQRADVDILFNELRGIHRHSGRELAFRIATVVGGTSLFVLGIYFLKSEELNLGGIYSWIVIAATGLFGYEAFVNLLSLGSRYTVDGSRIMMHHTFRTLSWDVHITEIRRIDLDVSGEPALIIRTVDDRRRTMKLPRSAEAQLHRFYPQLLRDDNGRLAKAEAPLARPQFIKWTIIVVVVLATLIGGTLFYLSRG